MANYFGNTPGEDEVDGVEFWKILTTLPGNLAIHSCGNEELLLPKETFRSPIKLGPGCSPTVDRFVVIEKEPAFPIGTPLHQLIATLNLKAIRLDLWSAKGTGEHWYSTSPGQELIAASPNDWFFLTPEGDLFKWDKARPDVATGQLMAILGLKTYAHPSVLLPPSVVA